MSSKEAVKFARREDPVGFKNEIHSSLSNKIVDALELKKMEIASHYLDDDGTLDNTEEVSDEAEE